MPTFALSLLLLFSRLGHTLRLGARTTARGNAGRVMIVTVAQNMDETRAQGEYDVRDRKYSNFGGMRQIKVNRDLYARTHGYESFTLTSHNETIKLPSIMKPGGQIGKPGAPGFDHPRKVTDARWMKVRVLKMLMSERTDIDWFVWIDGDAVIVDYQRSLDEFLLLAKDEHHLIIPSAQSGCLWSTNHFYIKNSEVGRRFVEKWFDMFTHHCIFAQMYRGCYFGDQCHMWQSVTDTLDEIAGVPKSLAKTKTTVASEHCSQETELETNVEARQPFNVSEPESRQLAKALDTLAWQSNTGGFDCRSKNSTNNQTRYAGVFVFAAHDYLMHDCNQGPQPWEVLRKAFILHKPRAGCDAFYKSVANVESSDHIS